MKTLYFMTRTELASYNRVCRAGNCRPADDTDRQRFKALMEKIDYRPDILRTDAGFRPVKCIDLNDMFEEEEIDNAA